MEPCTLHTGSVTRGGYGQVRAWVGGEYKVVGAHRLAYAAHHGLPLTALAGAVVRHTCDNPQCVNPAHLLLGTHKDNSDDKFLRGRARPARGASSGMAKLTAQDVAAIRAGYTRGNGRYLAARYGVSQPTISRIVREETWR